MARNENFGRFITFEGGEGAGKSTQIHKLAKRLAQQSAMVNIEVVTTREPGGSPVAEKIREILVTGDPDGITPKAELMLVMAARIEHVQKRIYPILRSGGWVLCDRFIDSTLAYQGYGRGMNTQHLTMLNQWAIAGLQPDLTILMDIDPVIGLARTKPRVVEQTSLTVSPEDRFEQEGIQFHRLVNAGFLKLAQAEPNRFVTIDASQDINTIHHAVWEAVSGVIPNL